MLLAIASRHSAMRGELVDPLQLRRLVISINGDGKRVVMEEGSKQSARILLVRVGYNAAADGEQGDGKFEKHDCMLVFGRKSWLMFVLELIVRCQFDLLDTFHSRVWTQYL